MNKFSEGDIVTHRVRQYEKMIIIEVLHTPQKKVDTYKCRWFNSLTQCFVTDNFKSVELKGVPDDK